MSGGTLDYAYSRVDRAARDVVANAQTPLHRAFAAHLFKVAKALHDLEWVLSSDTSPGDEVEAIRAVVTRTEEIEEATRAARQALNELSNILAEVDE